MSSDVVRIICPNLRCRAILSVPAVTRGKTVRCRLCGAMVKVPAHEPSFKPAPAAQATAATAEEEGKPDKGKKP